MFFEKTKERKNLPIYLNEDNEYQLKKSFFLEGEELLKELCCDIFRNEKHSDKMLKDNSDRHKYYVSLKSIKKVKEFKKGSREYIRQSNTKGGKNRFKNKDIEDIDDTKKGDREFLANFLKERLFRYMYWSECFKGIKSPCKKAEAIYYTLVLVQEIKRIAGNTSTSEKLLSDMQSFIKIHRISKKLLKSLIDKIYEEIKADKKLIFRRISTMIATIYKVNLMYIEDSMDYVKNDEDQFCQFYKMCLKIDKELNKNDT
ncbi:MAG: hypothetical protein JJW01_00160 [Alphaproteobacteria bacterium]|nr:hypothetical protein [Rickettsiales bacterium]